MTDNNYIDDIPVDGMTGVGESDSDFLAWSDIDVTKLSTLPIDDKVWAAVDQSYGDYTHACTLMSTYSAILSLFNLSEKKSEKDAIIKRAVEKGYKIWAWWLIVSGMTTAVTVWNDLHPDKKVLYFRTTINDGNFKMALDKGYPAVTWYKTSYAYTKDYKSDGVVDSKGFVSYVWGHAITAFKGQNWTAWTHLNTYPRGTYNIYSVRHGDSLVTDNTYYPSAYVLIPEGIYNLDTVKKGKIVGEIMKLNSELYTLSSSQTTKDMLHATNEYFRGAGFKANP